VKFSTRRAKVRRSDERSERSKPNEATRSERHPPWVQADRGPLWRPDATLMVRGQLWRLKMATGTVKWFNPTKGYGFIQPTAGGGRDVFVHISAVERAGLSSLNEGQTVEYEIESNRGKESAVNLKVR
jgi:cold shock protein